MRVRECMEKEIAPMMTEVLCLDFGRKKKLCIIYLFYCFTVLGEGEVPVSCDSEARCLGYSWGNDQGNFVFCSS